MFDFHEKIDICEIEKLMNWPQKINLRSVRGVKINRALALPAVLKFLGEPGA